MRVFRTEQVIFRLVVGVIVAGALAVIGGRLGGWVGAVIPAALVTGATVYLAFREPIRRLRTLQESFPESWREWLRRHVPFYRQLEDDRKRRFEADVQLYLDEHQFEGLPGLDVTEELRLAVASGAAMMLHNRPEQEFDTRRTILFYPGAFNGAFQTEGPYVDANLDGQARSQGPIILSVPRIEYDLEHPDDGENLIIHELAHQLDFGDQYADGLPAWVDAELAREWEQVARNERRNIQQGRSVLRDYAATDSAEFFAVATEAFFESPEALAGRHPDLYRLLTIIYNQDPAS